VPRAWRARLVRRVLLGWLDYRDLSEQLELPDWWALSVLLVHLVMLEVLEVPDCVDLWAGLATLELQVTIER